MRPKNPIFIADGTHTQHRHGHTLQQLRANLCLIREVLLSHPKLIYLYGWSEGGKEGGWIEKKKWYLERRHE